METINWKTPFYILALVVVCEFIYWTTSDFILFNEKTLSLGLEFLYYTSAAFLMLTLTLLITLLFEKIPVFGRDLLLVLTNTYTVVCILNIYFKACDPQKNLNFFYTGIVILILLLVAYLLIVKVLPRLKFSTILIVSIATVLLLVDSLFLFWGFRLFSPGN